MAQVTGPSTCSAHAERLTFQATLEEWRLPPNGSAAAITMISLTFPF